MRPIVVYYLAILLPIPLLIWISQTGNSTWFAVLLLIYAIPYRTFTDGFRLVDKNLMKWNEIWKLWLPWKYRELLIELYFRK
ncbi:MAG: hypothetical protein WCP08_16750 [Prolixibacteraceae bacterium]